MSLDAYKVLYDRVHAVMRGPDLEKHAVVTTATGSAAARAFKAAAPQIQAALENAQRAGRGVATLGIGGGLAIGAGGVLKGQSDARRAEREATSGKKRLRDLGYGAAAGAAAAVAAPHIYRVGRNALQGYAAQYPGPQTQSRSGYQYI